VVANAALSAILLLFHLMAFSYYPYPQKNYEVNKNNLITSFWANKTLVKLLHHLQSVLVSVRD
jgi:hypothetical protein